MTIVIEKPESILSHGLYSFQSHFRLSYLQNSFVRRVPLNFSRRRKHTQKLKGKNCTSIILINKFERASLLMHKHLNGDFHSLNPEQAKSRPPKGRSGLIKMVPRQGHTPLDIYENFKKPSFPCTILCTRNERLGSANTAHLVALSGAGE